MLALLALLSIATEAQTTDVAAKLSGTTSITGSVVTNRRGQRVNAFLGIRYAEAPTGAKRWKPSKFLRPTGALAAKSVGSTCYSDEVVSNVPASEDCLFLNVFAPGGTNAKSNLPVIVWTHSGIDWNSGDPFTLYGSTPVNATATPLVAVTFNVRVGLFGWLANQQLLKEGNGANAALRDMANAFQWVRTYIRAFGGNPNNITAVGQGTGAVMLALQLLADNGGQKLFDKAILESGGYPSFAELSRTAEQDAHIATLAGHVGCTDASAAKVLACLRLKDASALMAAGSALEWRPIVDNKTLVDLPYKLVAANKVSKIPTMTGTNTNDGNYMTQTVWSLNDVTTMIQARLGTVLTTADLKKLNTLYPPSAFPTLSDLGGEIFGDAMIVCPSEKLAQTLAPFNAAYHYRFNELSGTNGAPLRAHHYAEQLYVFNVLDASVQPLVTAIQTFWTSFARYGSPNGAKDTAESVWPRFDAKRRQLVLQKTLVTETNGAYMPQYAQRCAFWNSIEARVASGSAYKPVAV